MVVPFQDPICEFCGYPPLVILPPHPLILGGQLSMHLKKMAIIAKKMRTNAWKCKHQTNQTQIIGNLPR